MNLNLKFLAYLEDSDFAEYKSNGFFSFPENWMRKKMENLDKNNKISLESARKVFLVSKDLSNLNFFTFGKGN